ncbi:MAG TPA: hypothetical protein VGL71_14710 [Urbifossiella sp.]|jgi:hypothetical protein
MNPHSEPDSIPSECGPTLERIQAVLDRIHPESILAADPHPAACSSCRQRVRAARLVLGLPSLVAFTPPRDFTETILAGVLRDRRTRRRRKVFALVGGFAAAAAIVLAVWFNPPKPIETAKQIPTPVPGPQMTETPEAVAPMHVNEELAKAGEALRESSRTITEPASSAPKVFAALSESLLSVPASPAGIDLGPAGKSLSEIPEAARAGLEPVTGTAQKAFNRLLHDVSFMQPKMKS